MNSSGIILPPDEEGDTTVHPSTPKKGQYRSNVVATPSTSASSRSGTMRSVSTASSSPMSVDGRGVKRSTNNSAVSPDPKRNTSTFMQHLQLSSNNKKSGVLDGYEEEYDSDDAPPGAIYFDDEDQVHERCMRLASYIAEEVPKTHIERVAFIAHELEMKAQDFKMAITALGFRITKWPKGDALREMFLKAVTQKMCEAGEK